MDDQILRSRIKRACVQREVDPELRRKLTDNSWKDVIAVAREQSDEFIDEICGEIMEGAAGKVIASGIKQRRYWVTRSQPVDEARLLPFLQNIGGVIGTSSPPTSVLVVPNGSPRQREGIDPAWAGVLASINNRMLVVPAEFNLDCRLANSVISPIHANDAHLARIYFVGALLGALDGNNLPWDLLYRLLLDGLLVEAFYADGSVQVGTRVVP